MVGWEALQVLCNRVEDMTRGQTSGHMDVQWCCKYPRLLQAAAHCWRGAGGELSRIVCPLGNAAYGSGDGQGKLYVHEYGRVL
jgi:hypothetical protein